MGYCTNSCEDCPVGKVENPVERELDQRHIGSVFNHYQPRELRAANEGGEIDRLIKAANSAPDENTGEHIASPDLDLDLVKSAVMRIAEGKCSSHLI